MRHYRPLYNSKDGSWSVIFKEDLNDTFYMYQDDVRDKETAVEIADALNRAQVDLNTI